MSKIKVIPYDKWDYEIDERISKDCSEAQYHQDYWTEDNEREIVHHHNKTKLIEYTHQVKEALEKAGIEAVNAKR